MAQHIDPVLQVLHVKSREGRCLYQAKRHLSTASREPGRWQAWKEERERHGFVPRALAWPDLDRERSGTPAGPAASLAAGSIGDRRAAGAAARRGCSHHQHQGAQPEVARLRLLAADRVPSSPLGSRQVQMKVVRRQGAKMRELAQALHGVT